MVIIFALLADDKRNNSFGIAFTKNIALRATTTIKIGSSGRAEYNGTIEIIRKYTTGNTNNGRKFFSIFLIFRIPRASNGIRIIIKKWTVMSPIKNITDVVIRDVVNIVIMLFLLNFIFSK